MKETGHDMLPPGRGLRFTQIQVWIGPKTSTYPGSSYKTFKVVSIPGILKTYLYELNDSDVNGRKCS